MPLKIFEETGDRVFSEVTSVTTDTDGRFEVTLQEDRTYKIEGGLPTAFGQAAASLIAVNGENPGDFDDNGQPDVYDSGLNLGIRSNLVLAFVRNLELGGVCLRRPDATDTSRDQAVFTYTNNLSVPVQVPLSFAQLNQIFSSTGGATPPETFASGSNKVSFLMSEFSTGETFAGFWKLLGTTAIINGTPSLCPDSGDPDPTPTPTPDPSGCIEVDEGAFSELTTFTRAVVFSQVQRARSYAAKMPRWPEQASSQKYVSNLVFERGADVLVSIKALSKKYQKTYICGTPLPAGCRNIEVDKKAFRKAFGQVYNYNLSGLPQQFQGLKALMSKNSKQEREGFQTKLSDLPSKVARCSSPPPLGRPR
jgi:hypothetical protein